MEQNCVYKDKFEHGDVRKIDKLMKSNLSKFLQTFELLEVTEYSVYYTYIIYIVTLSNYFETLKFQTFDSTS